MPTITKRPNTYLAVKTGLQAGICCWSHLLAGTEDTNMKRVGRERDIQTYTNTTRVGRETDTHNMKSVGREGDRQRVGRREGEKKERKGENTLGDEVRGRMREKKGGGTVAGQREKGKGGKVK